MARRMFAVLVGATLIASPVFANGPVRPSATAMTLQPGSLQAGARVGAITTSSKKQADLTQAATGGILALFVAGGIGIGLATDNGGHGTSP